MTGRAAIVALGIAAAAAFAAGYFLWKRAPGSREILAVSWNTAGPYGEDALRRWAAKIHSSVEAERSDHGVVLTSSCRT